MFRSAERHGIFVRIDMEHSGLTDQTLEIYRGLRAAGHHGTGVVIQAYMRRSADDIAGLADLTPNVRLVKGIYVEPEEIAFTRMPEINANFMRLLEQLVDQGSYVAVATHDRALVTARSSSSSGAALRPTDTSSRCCLGWRGRSAAG